MNIKVPGRLNWIGEHTDYNGGLSIPFAIDKYIDFHLTETSKREIQIFSNSESMTLSFEKLKSLCEGSPDDALSFLKANSFPDWGEYFLGCAIEFIKESKTDLQKVQKGFHI